VATDGLCDGTIGGEVLDTDIGRGDGEGGRGTREACSSAFLSLEALLHLWKRARGFSRSASVSLEVVGFGEGVGPASATAPTPAPTACSGGWRDALSATWGVVSPLPTVVAVREGAGRGGLVVVEDEYVRRFLLLTSLSLSAESAGEEAGS